jgi:N-dimethylarginine dimethylaminohydrolase
MTVQWRVESEYGVLRDVLLCRPAYFKWLPLNFLAAQSLAAGKQPGQADIEAQYEELLAAFADAGVRTHFVVPEPHLSFQVYTRDSSTVTPWGPVLSQHYREVRRGEYAPILKFYGPDRFFQFANEGNVEGGDVHIIRPGLLLMGCSGGRTTRPGAEQYTGWFKAKGWETRIYEIPELFVHLDVAFCMAAPGLAVACTEVLEPDLIDWLQAHSIRLLPVTYHEMMQLGANLLALGNDRIISPRHNKRVNEMLRSEGLTVYDPTLDAFTAIGGGVHCMTQSLARDPV